MWNELKHHFEGHSQDLIEVIYEDITPEIWTTLFHWLDGKISHLMTKDGYDDVSTLSLESVLSGDCSYVVTLISTDERMPLELSIIDDELLEINIELEEIQSAAEFELYLKTVTEIATVIQSTNYYICPEYKKDESFMINGKLV